MPSSTRLKPVDLVFGISAPEWKQVFLILPGSFPEAGRSLRPQFGWTRPGEQERSVLATDRAACYLGWSRRPASPTASPRSTAGSRQAPPTGRPAEGRTYHRPRPAAGLGRSFGGPDLFLVVGTGRRQPLSRRVAVTDPGRRRRRCRLPTARRSRLRSKSGVSMHG